MGRVRDLVNMIGDGRLGFKIQEEMSGTHEFTDQAEQSGTHPMSFTADWGPQHLSEWLNPVGEGFMSHPMTGSVSVGGLCESVAFEGSMQLRYFSESKIRYEFDFSYDGVDYHYEGEKRDIRLTNLHRSHTTLYGRLVDTTTDTVVSQSTLYFHFSTLPAMLLSLRFA